MMQFSFPVRQSRDGFRIQEPALRSTSAVPVNHNSSNTRERVMFTSKYTGQLRLFTWVAVLLSFAAVAAFGQTVTTGDIAGTVADATGAVIPAATVTLKSLDTGETRTVQTNTEGAYRFIFLKPGNYSISAKTAGLASDTNKVLIEVGQVANLNLTAKVQTVSQTIEVNES